MSHYYYYYFICHIILIKIGNSPSRLSLAVCDDSSGNYQICNLTYKLISNNNIIHELIHWIVIHKHSTDGNSFIVNNPKKSNLLLGALIGLDRVVDVLHRPLNETDCVWSLGLRVDTLLCHNCCYVPEHRLQLGLPFLV